MNDEAKRLCEFCDGGDPQAMLDVCPDCWNAANAGSGWMHRALIAEAHLLDLLEAVRAGGRYSDALRRYQEQGVHGRMIPATEELDRLFMDWHDKGHAALEKAEAR